MWEVIQSGGEWFLLVDESGDSDIYVVQGYYKTRRAAEQAGQRWMRQRTY